MPKLTINGKVVEVPEGTNLIEAAKAIGVEVPHYCYHPSLSIAGQCRLCMVDIEKVPRPQIACNTQATEGMVVDTETERVKDTRRSMMEFHLINHPLDCPVCDQAGECFLQIYYMKHGLYDPRMTDEKVHKPKAVPLGPHVILDAERCILCSRCVRYCDEVTHTGELGIFQRGDHSEIGLFPGKALENKYSGNVIDICPVGALTDRDFRFKVRVWYLDTAKSVCNGCARGCNIEVHTNKHRHHHNEGRRVARLKPRFNADVNKWWVCDAGRYGFRWVDDKSRLREPQHRVGSQGTDVSWDRALQEVASSLRRYRAEEIGFLASPQMSNEDLWALKGLAEQLGVKNLDFRVPPAVPGDEDDVLIRADKNPNTRGAVLCGIAPGSGGLDAAGMLRAAREKRIKLLWIFHHDLAASAWPEAEVLGALDGAETVIFQGTNANDASVRAHLVLPSAAYVEREGTFTNFQGRVQRFRTAVPPLGLAWPDWMILSFVGKALGFTDPVFAAERSEQIFNALAGAAPPFAGLTYRAIGDTGSPREGMNNLALDLLLQAIPVAFTMFVVLNFGGLLTWVERKQSAIMQDRLGANRASIFGIRVLGLLHPLADAIKMLTKEDFMPARADRLMFKLAPFVSVFFALAAFASIPFGDTLKIAGREIQLQAVTLNVGILYVLAMLSLGVYGLMMAGWASANNYALLGGQRAAALMISAEVAIGASIMGVVMVYGSLNMQDIARAQGLPLLPQYFGPWIPAWGILTQPLAFVLFLTAGIAATKRIPFDMPEGESEIIGYFVEYSGMKFGMFAMADFLETVVIAGMTTALFLGGWQVPYLGSSGFSFPWGMEVPLPQLLVTGIQVIAFLTKVVALIWFLMLIRWTLPRFRYDQAMRLGWLGLFPLSILNIVITGLVLLLLGKA